MYGMKLVNYLEAVGLFYIINLLLRNVVRLSDHFMTL